MTTNTKYAIYVGLILASAFLALNEWRMYFDKKNNVSDLPVFEQCEKVFVQKTPFGCNAGELIFIDASVANMYCTERVFSRDEDTVYCEYNGKRPDRDTAPLLFKKRTDN